LYPFVTAAAVLSRKAGGVAPGALPPPTGADKTTIQVALPVNESGALLTLLEQFSARGVDLSRIESRPSGDGLGNYTFSIDIVGHIREERVQAALVGLHRYSPEVRFMGSYPRVDGVRASVTPGTTDEAFRAGRAWVADLLHGGGGRDRQWNGLGRVTVPLLRERCSGCPVEPTLRCHRSC